MPTPPDTDNSSNVSPAADVTNDDNTRAASPAPSSSGSALSSVIENTHDEHLGRGRCLQYSGARTAGVVAVAVGVRPFALHLQDSMIETTTDMV
jgi:hypothetical protein